MIKIKIISNPYTREISFLNYNEVKRKWEKIAENNENSRLREFETDGNFLPFKIKEIVDIVISEYYIGNDKIQLTFDGTNDEYLEIENVCNNQKIRNKIEIVKGDSFLENARVIFQPTKEIFDTVQPIIEDIIKDDTKVNSDLNKVADALKDIIPICVFGNYSAGKSTFINALIGEEVLPSGGDPVTAKVYKITRSKYDDSARIKFTYKEELLEIIFEGDEYRLLQGNQDNDIIQSIFNAIEDSEKNLKNNVRIALEIINGYEKKDREEIVISDEIDMEIPFSKKGILGQSYNNFVIFDTPGSNSESNAEHYKVLEGALEGFSNGIPVWVSTYESVDSTDNASLCEKILNIKALDKRFSMIILNKADGSDLDEDGFSEEKEQEILEYNSIEKMYASGIYFVSSIMGLGAKKIDGLEDKHYRKIFRSQKEMYCDPYDEDYVALYKYNIMPYQIKRNVEDYSEKCENIIYANSGLYCVEQEMENFASKYAAYNKCQMVYMFLKSVVAETDKRIDSRTMSLENTRDARTRELELQKAMLLDELNKSANDCEYSFCKEAKSYKKNFITSNVTYKYKMEELENIADEYHKENEEDRNFSIQQIEYVNSKNKLLSNVKKNGVDVFSGKGNILGKIGKMKDEFVQDLGEYKENREEKMSVEKEIDKDTSDKLIKSVIEQYKINLSSAQAILSDNIKNHWQENAQTLRNKLVAIITGTDALSTDQREEMTNMIINYQPVQFDDAADNIFIKTYFLRGTLWGIQVIDDEKLNIRKLSNRYNSEIAKAIEKISDTINNSSEESFKNWKTSLLGIIEQNITDYNPKLRDMSAMIKEESDKIAELKYDQATIQQSIKEIAELMSWKTIEQGE